LIGLRRAARRLLNEVFVLTYELAAVPILVAVAAAARHARREIDVGIGPEPLINSPAHKLALERQGYTAETYVFAVWHQTAEFDVRADRRVHATLAPYWLFARAVLRYRCLYIYFNGGPLARTNHLGRLEPWLLRLADVRVVVMPYGSDVADLSRTPNHAVKHGYSKDYPQHRFTRGEIARRIDLWTTWADHVIGGCDWVDYLHHWDTLMLAHFAVDPDRWTPPPPLDGKDRPLRVLHAPNHRTIKGTDHFVRAIQELRDEGVAIELIVLERVPNDEVKRVLATVDVVADQLHMGWYAMFALEAMMMAKPVLCYLRQDLLDFYVGANLLRPDEVPIVNCSPLDVKEKLRALADDRDALPALGRRSREFALRHHSVDAIGRRFSQINAALGLTPSVAPVAEPRPVTSVVA
jgi:glycosyltransferase involved in cell wall biosynthesis